MMSLRSGSMMIQSVELKPIVERFTFHLNRISISEFGHLINLLFISRFQFELCLNSLQIIEINLN